MIVTSRRDIDALRKRVPGSLGLRNPQARRRFTIGQLRYEEQSEDPLAEKSLPLSFVGKTTLEIGAEEMGLWGSSQAEQEPD